MARRDLMDRLPERQLDPSLATRTYVARRSGAYGGVRRTNAASTRGGAGGAGGGALPFAGSTQKVATLPADPADAVTGTIYHVQGAEGEDDRLVYAIRKADGTLEYREVTQREESWPVSYVGQWGGPGLGNSQFEDIRDIAVRADTGDVYVSSDNRVQKFTANGTYVSTIATAGSNNGQVDTPWGLAGYVSSVGFILDLIDSGNHRVQRFLNDAYGSKSGTLGTGVTNLDSPRGITLLPVVSGNNFFRYIADTGNSRVNARNLSEQWGSPGTAPGEFDTPTGITCDAQRRIYVVDTGNHRVQVFDPFGTFLLAFGQFGASKGQFNTPQGIAVDARGNVYVVDSGNHRVQVFDSAGVFQAQFGKLGDGDGEFDSPTGIAITDDYIYICDSGNSRVHMFSNPVAPALGEIITVSKAATTGVSNTSTSTYVTAVEIDAYTDFGSGVNPLVLPKGTWEFIAEYSQTYFPTSVATWGIWGRFNGTDGATTAQMLANTGGARASMLALHTGEYVSDGVSTFSIRFEFIRHSSWTATPSTEPGFMTVTFRRVA